MPPKKTPPGPVPKEALDYWAQKGIKVGFDHREIWKEEHSAAFTIAKVMETDVLATVRGMAERALEEGTTFEEFRKNVQPLLDKSGWSDYGNGKGSKARIELIFDTNMRVARAAGQWQRIEQTKRVRPFLVYFIGPSTNHREVHVSWDGTMLPIDDPWWDDHMTPNGHRCKCGIRQVSRREAERLGGVTDRPPSHDVPWKNEVTGKTEQVPVGIQPGWNFNPGKDRMRGVRQLEERAR
ncbi:MAG: hypothetical protein KAS19_12705 [Anaerolineales bacterium]|nr:hypothetical protein [Anaerolineales bacterium]